MADLDALVRFPNGKVALPNGATLSCLAEKRGRKRCHEMFATHAENEQFGL